MVATYGDKNSTAGLVIVECKSDGLIQNLNRVHTTSTPFHRNRVDFDRSALFPLQVFDHGPSY